MPVVDRMNMRSEIREEDKADIYASIYEIIERITSELVRNNRELVTDITLGAAPESALEAAVVKTINRYNLKVLGKQRNELIKEVLDNIFRYGILQKLLDVGECNGVFVNGPSNVWAKLGSRMVKSDVDFGSPQNVTHFIYTIKAKLRGEINENNPLAKFDDPVNKLRIICCIPPMAHISPTVAIRKHGREGFSLSDLVGMGMLDAKMAEELKLYNSAGANIIVCGRGGAGKTTLIRALLEELPREERLLVMEEQPELFLKHPNAVQIIVKRSENGKLLGISDIAEKGLLMTIDRYVFGEVRADEAMAFFYGTFSGNTSMTSLHAGSARQALRKAMVMMKMSGADLGDEILMDMLQESVNIIVYLDSFVAAEVVEVVKTDDGTYYNDLWRFNIDARHSTFIEGRFEKTGEIRSRAMLNKLGNIKPEGGDDKIEIFDIRRDNDITVPGDIPDGDKHRF